MVGEPENPVPMGAGVWPSEPAVLYIRDMEGRTVGDAFVVLLVDGGLGQGGLE